MMPFQDPYDNDHYFLRGTTFDNILDHYVFDREIIFRAFW